MRNTREGFTPLLAVEESDLSDLKSPAALNPETEGLGLVEKPEALKKLEGLVDDRIQEDGKPVSRAFQSLFSLVTLFVVEKTKKHLDIWVFSCFFFYVDFGLDVRMMFFFFTHEDKYFMFFTGCGIALAVLYTLAEFGRNARRTDPTWMILCCGFLLPFQMHVLFLCIYSAIYEDRRAHPLLHCFKLAESALEATVSALIQSYAMIFRHLHEWDYMFTFLSCTTSYASIAYCFCQVDRRDGGLQGLPGVSMGWCWRLALVFLFRMCEVLSRLVSVALFQLAVRNEKIFMEYNLHNTGGLCICILDFIIMFVLTAIYQGITKAKEHRNWFNCVYSPLSVIVFINPLLLKENAFTIPCWLYYSVRLVELSLMGLIGWKSEVFHGGGRPGKDFTDHDPDNNYMNMAGFEKEFYDDHVVLYAFAVATILMYILLPIIRSGSINVLLEDKEMFTATKFGPAQVFLCDEIMRTEGKQGLEKEWKDCEDFHRNCKEVVDNAATRLRASINQNKKNKKGERGVIKRHQSMDMTHGKARVEVEDDQSRTGWIYSHLERWLDRQYDHAMADWNVSRSLPELFEELIRVGNNLHHWLKGDEDFFFLAHESQEVDARYKLQTTYLQYLEVLAEVLNPLREESEEITGILEKRGVIRMILKAMPGWSFNTTDQRLLEQSLLMFEKRCLIISRLVEMGWEKEGRGFHQMAIELRDAFDVHCTDEALSETGLHENTKSTVDPRDWIVRVQMGALVTMYSTIPKKIREQTCHLSIMSHPVDGLFRKDKEIRAVMHAAELCMRQRQKEAEGELHFGENTVLETVDMIKQAFNSDDMKYAPSWDKQWDTNSALNMMTTADTHLQLISVVKCAAGKEEDVIIKKPSDLFALLPSDEEGVLNAAGVVLKFKFRRLVEIEDQPLGRIKKGSKDDWHIHETALLNLFTSLGADGENAMIRLCGGRDNDLVTNFVKYRDEVAQNVCEALDRKKQLLKTEGVHYVAPKTATNCADLLRFRQEVEEGKSWSIKEIGRLKNKSQASLQEYEKVIDAMKEYLAKVGSKFSWSDQVKTRVKEMKEEVAQILKSNRKDVGDYWNNQEGLVTQAATEKEAQATLAKKAAEEKELQAVEREKEAEEKAKTRERDAMMAEAQAHSAEEKAKAEKEKADATIQRAEIQLDAAKRAQAGAEQDRDKAKEELEMGQRMMQTAYSDQAESRQKQEQAENAVVEAKAREEAALKQEKIVENKMKFLEEREAKVREACTLVKAETTDESDTSFTKLYSSVAGIIGF